MSYDTIPENCNPKVIHKLAFEVRHLHAVLVKVLKRSPTGNWNFELDEMLYLCTLIEERVDEIIYQSDF